MGGGVKAGETEGGLEGGRGALAGRLLIHQPICQGGGRRWDWDWERRLRRLMAPSAFPPRPSRRFPRLCSLVAWRLLASAAPWSTLCPFRATSSERLSASHVAPLARALPALFARRRPRPRCARRHRRPLRPLALAATRPPALPAQASDPLCDLFSRPSLSPQRPALCPRTPPSSWRLTSKRPPRRPTVCSLPPRGAHAPSQPHRPHPAANISTPFLGLPRLPPSSDRPAPPSPISLRRV